MNRHHKSWIKGPGAVLLTLAVLFLVQGCASAPITGDPSPAVDAELAAAKRMARFAFDNRDFEQAETIYRRALARAYIRNDSAEILDSRYNLAVCLMALEEYDEALELVGQAKADLAADKKTHPADLLLLEATLYYRSERLEEALGISETILDRAPGLSHIIAARTHFLRGLIFARRDDPKALKASIAGMGTPQIDTLRSDLLELRGRQAMAAEDWEQAVGLLDQASRLRREGLDYRRMVISQALAAAASEQAGEIEAAANRYLQAGRSAALNGDRINAGTWLTRAVRLYEDFGNPALANEASQLLDDIAKSAESKSQN